MTAYLMSIACLSLLSLCSAPAADDNWGLLFDRIPVLPCEVFSSEYLSSWASLGPSYGLPSQILEEFKE